MYKPQKVYDPTRFFERFLHAVAVWHSLSEEQKDSVCDTYDHYEGEDDV